MSFRRPGSARALNNRSASITGRMIGKQLLACQEGKVRPLQLRSRRFSEHPRRGPIWPARRGPAGGTPGPSPRGGAELTESEAEPVANPLVAKHQTVAG